MKAIGLFVVLTFLLNVAVSQVNRKLFPLNREYKKSGFSITPLATVSFGNKTVRDFSNLPGWNYEVIETGRGTWNAGLELSYLKFFDGYQVGDYFEGALSYRRNSGVHYLEAKAITVPNNLLTVAPVELENKWRFETTTASIRVMDIAFQKPNRFISDKMNSSRDDCRIKS